MDHLDAIWNEARPAFGAQRTWQRGKRLALSTLVCLGRHTITGMLVTSGRQFHDWSADYRLFEQGRFDLGRLFAPARRRTVAALTQGQDIVAHLDDTRCRKWGKKVAGASWHRDPLGPRFRTQFIWAHRFLQISLALPEGKTPCAARAIPVDLQHCPCARKPKRTAAPEAWNEYKRLRKQQRLPRIAAQRLAQLRADLDADPSGPNRRLVVSVDGGFTNTTVFRAVPHNTTLIGRIRKDAKLYAPPDAAAPRRRGRRRIYGAPLPTPEAMRKDDEIPWTTVTAWAAGRRHSFRIKTVSPVRWRGAGKHNLRLVILAPLQYRLSKHARVLYRQPAYLIVTDPDLPLEKAIQYYLWRWGIEVDFRDEKTILGMGEAQVWTEQSVARVPAFIAAAYAYLQLAVHAAYGHNGPCPLAKPKWQKQRPHERITTAQMVKLLRGEIWGQALGVRNFSDFAAETLLDVKSGKCTTHLKSAVLCTIR
jgi:hypothetical protein